MWVGRESMTEDWNAQKKSAKYMRLVGTACHYGFIY
jgi:hypothetical protein